MTQPSLKEIISNVSHGDHCCLVFVSIQEQINLTVPFLALGLERDERCLFVGDRVEIELVREGLKNEGINVEKESQKGRLFLSSDRDYLDQGHWSTEKMIGFLQQAYDAAIHDGFTALRTTGDVSWEVGPDHDFRDIIYFESLLDIFFINKKMIAMCSYPRDKCPPEILDGILKTHKIAAVDSKLCSNFHYQPTDLLLENDEKMRHSVRVEWMTSQLVKIKQAEEASAKAISELISEKQELKRVNAELERAHSELIRMKKIEDTFGLFVAPEVVKHILETPQTELQKGTIKNVTILFADVRQFTPYAMANPPEEVVNMLNKIFSRIVSPIHAQGGVLNKFMGDGILVLFGAPIDSEHHANSAALAAIEIREASEEFAKSLQLRGQPLLKLGIGINTGKVIAGCLGTQDRTEYSVIGHTVNVAARLVGMAKPGQILLGPETHKVLGEMFEFREMGPVKLKGVPESMVIWELLGSKF